MRIASLDAFELSAGAGRWAVVRVRADDGLSGWAEGPAISDGAAAAAWVAAVRGVGDRVVGGDPRRHGAIVQAVQAALSAAGVTGEHGAGGHVMAGHGAGGSVAAALDVGLHDLLARSLEVPAYDLLGGLYRERIPVYLALPRLDPLDDAAVSDADAAIDAAVARGFRTLKLRLSGGSGAVVREDWIEAGARVARRVRERAGTEVGLIVDIGARPNGAVVVRLARALGDVGVRWLELGGLSPLGLRSTADQTRVRLCHGAALDRAGLLPYLEAHATDIVAVSPAIGGLAESRRVTELASHFDAMSCAADDVGPLGLLAGIQLCATAPGIEMLGIDAGAWEALTDLLDQHPTIEDGELVVPPGHGIGATIAEERLVPMEATRA